MTGALVLLGVMLLYALDPLLDWAKQRYLGQAAPPFEPPFTLYKRLAIALPLATASGVLALSVARGPSVPAIVVPIAISLVLARYFYNRAKGRPAWFFKTYVDPADPDYANDQLDLIAVLVSFGFVAMLWVMALWPQALPN